VWSVTQTGDAHVLAPGQEPVAWDAGPGEVVERLLQGHVVYQRREFTVELRVGTPFGQGGCQPRDTTNVDIPGGRIVGDVLEVAVAAQDGCSRLRTEARQPGDAVGGVADQREQIRDRRGWDPGAVDHPCLVEEQVPTPVDLHDVLAADDLAEVLVGGEDADLIGLVSEAQSGRCERVVGLPLVHRPHDDADAGDGRLHEVELCEQGRVDAGAVLVGREPAVAEALDRVVEGDGKVGDRLLLVVEEPQEARDHADGGLHVATRGVDPGWCLPKVRAEQFEGAVDQV
jgi:hypothetical protein